MNTTQGSSQKPYLVPVMDKKQSFIFRCLTLVWVAVLCWFWLWWLQGEHMVSLFGTWLSSFVLICTTVLPAWYFYFAGRMKRPNDAVELPDGTIGIFVTKVPSESFKYVIVPTLKAAIRAKQAYPFPDRVKIFLCDEDPSHDTNQAWCDARGIEIISRKGVKAYHNAEFPRRTRTKEGNLSFAYDWLKAQNRLPDFMLQLDADHVPSPTYIIEIMRAFADESVGYVAAPSICDKNMGESWVVDARSAAEATMHGSLQAGYNGGWAPMPIGSHYALRAEAFLQLEHPKPNSFWDRKYTIVTATLGPDLAEDHSTGLAMNAAGWRGAFALNAIAHGDGAASFADSITQEFQWSRSLMVLLLKWTPMYFKSSYLSKKLKGQYLFAQIWYPLFALYMLIGVLMPPVAVLLGVSWVSVGYLDWLMHSIPLTLACLLPVWYIRSLKALRPDDAPLMSWKTFVFQFIRWPWALWGCLHAFVGVVILNKELPFKVTPKGVQGPKPLPFKALAPYVFVVIAQILPLFLVQDAGAAKGYAWFCLLNATTYMGIIALVIYQHIRENELNLSGPLMTGRLFARPLAAAVMMVLLVLAAVAYKGPEATQAIFLAEVANEPNSLALRPTPVPTAIPVIDPSQEGQ